MYSIIISSDVSIELKPLQATVSRSDIELQEQIIHIISYNNKDQNLAMVVARIEEISAIRCLR